MADISDVSVSVLITNTIRSHDGLVFSTVDGTVNLDLHLVGTLVLTEVEAHNVCSLLQL